MKLASDRSAQKTVYRVEGLSCANCAKKFETNVKGLPGVRDAVVNFGAAKITVYGEATIEQLERAGKFEDLKVVPEPPFLPADRPDGRSSASTAAPWFKKHGRLLISGLLTAFGLVFMFMYGETSVMAPLLFGAAMLTGGHALFATGLKNLARLDFDMKTLMTVAIIGAAIIGEWAEGAIVVLLFAASESLERFSMERARQSLRSLLDVAPKEALVRREEREMRIPVSEITVGDTIIVKPGQKIAMDGIVVKGGGTVNQAAITGESMPVFKSEGDGVFAGTLNGEGLLEIRVTKRVQDSTIAKIIHLVEEAQAGRAPAQTFVDAFAKHYTPAMIVLAALVAVLPPLVMDGDWGKWAYLGLSVLVVGCPCALVISTPVSIVTAIGSAAKNGVLIKGGIHLEQLGKVKAVAFDKTGTLTRGEPVVTDYAVFHDQTDAAALLAIIASLENRANHPLAAAIVRKAEQEGADDARFAVERFEAVPGKGVRGTILDTAFIVGSPAWLAELNHPGWTGERMALAESFEREGKTVIMAGTDRELLALLAVKDDLRDSAKPAIQALHRLGVRHTVLLTGDNRNAAEAIRHEAGIAEAEAELLPEAKWKAVHRLQARYGQTAMVGDGINDAPALAAATVGIAMGGSGTDVALETADVTLMGDDLAKLPFAIRLGRKTLAVIKQNIAFSLAVKAFALLLVIPGWLTLWIAIASDMGATLLVTLNALRLMRRKAPADPAASG